LLSEETINLAVLKSLLILGLWVFTY